MIGGGATPNRSAILGLAAVFFTLVLDPYAQISTIETETETFVTRSPGSTSSSTHLYNDRFGTQSIVVLVEGDSVTSPASLKAMERLTRQMETVEDVLGTVSIAELVMEVEASETGVRRVPESQGRIDEILAGLEGTNPEVISAILPGRSHTIISIDLPSFIPQERIDAVLPVARAAVKMAEFPAGADTIVTGEVALGDEIEREMNTSMGTLLLISGLLMVVALLLVFRHVNLPLLPLPTVILGIKWTLRDDRITPGFSDDYYASPLARSSCGISS